MKCIEPDAGLRAEFSNVVKDPRVSIVYGTFDETGVPDKWADFVVVASVSRLLSARPLTEDLKSILQAFHYCNDLEAAVKEFIRILKCDGVVCFLWNPEDRFAY